MHAFLVGLEYLNICDFSHSAGPLRYLSELEEWRHEHRGLALLLTVDTLIRKKVYRLNADQRKTFPSFSSALVEVLTHHKQLWNDARSSAELEKFKQAGHTEAPSTPPRKHLKRDRSSSPAKASPSNKAKKNKARRERQKQLVKSARETIDARKKETPKKDARVPAAEWSKINSFKYKGANGAHGSITRSAAASVISARVLTCALSAARSTLGMATTEAGRPRLVRLLRPHQQQSLRSLEARMKRPIGH